MRVQKIQAALIAQYTHLGHRPNLSMRRPNILFHLFLLAAIAPRCETCVAHSQNLQMGQAVRTLCPVLCGICTPQVASANATSAEEARDELFAKLDGDSDGKVTSSDVDAFCSEAPGDSGTKCNTTKFMAVLNISIDGSVSKVQFDAAVAQTGGISEIGLRLEPPPAGGDTASANGPDSLDNGVGLGMST